jgi:hypothetical protein
VVKVDDLVVVLEVVEVVVLEVVEVVVLEVVEVVVVVLITARLTTEKDDVMCCLVKPQTLLFKGRNSIYILVLGTV